MIDLSKISYLCNSSHILNYDDSKIWKELDLLSIFQNERSLNLNSFYTNLNKVISYSEIIQVNKNPDIQSPELLNRILSIIKWTTKIWTESINNPNLDRTIISILILNRLDLSLDEHINWRLDFENFTSYLEKILPSLTFKVEFDNIEELPYPDRKFHLDYQEALKNNDPLGILFFLKAQNRGSYDNVNVHFITALIIIIKKIDLSIIVKNLENYSPFLIYTIFKHLSVDEILDILSFIEVQEVRTYILGIEWILTKSISDDLIDDTIHKAGNLVDKLNAKLPDVNLFSYIINCCNAKNNKSWYFIYIDYLITFKNNSDSIHDFVKQIDLSIDLGKDIYEMIVKRDDDFLLLLSDEIYDSFFTYLLGDSYKSSLFCYTSFINFLFTSIQSQAQKNNTNFDLLLEEKSIQLKRTLNSWELKNRYSHFTEWVCWIIVSKIIGINNKNQLSTFQELLYDERLFNMCKTRTKDYDVTFEELRVLFERPDEFYSINLPTHKGCATITFHHNN